MTRLLYPKKTALSAFCLLTFLFGGHGLAQCLNVVGPTVPLYWDANSEPDIDHYNVYRSSTSGSGFSVMGTPSQSPDPVSLTDMTPLSTGYYVVTSVNDSGLESDFSNELCVMLTGTPPNNTPTALADSASTSEDMVVNIDVLSNDDDVDGDALTVDSVTQPANGSVVINADETVAYTPASNFNGGDGFSYTVADGQGGTDMATVTINISAVNDAPTATVDSASTSEDIAIIIDVLSNDDDVDGDTLTVDSVTQPGGGSVVINGDETVAYTPASNFNGSDSFDYTIIDGQGGTDTATVTVTVSTGNDAPIAVADSASTDEDIAVTINVLGNDDDVDGDTLTVDSVTQPTNGSVLINADQTVAYTPASNFNGSDNFSYTVTDGQGTTDSANVTVTVIAVEDAPIAADDSASTPPGVPVVIDVLGNDQDPDGDVLTVNSLTQPANGSVAMNADQTLSYMPASNFNGSDSFAYTVADSQGSTDTATVTVMVSGDTVLVANFMNGNDEALNSRVYLWNPTASAGAVTARVFTLPLAGGTAQELTSMPIDLGTLQAESALNVKLAEDILTQLGTPAPYTDDGGNLIVEFTIGAPGVRGAGQVFTRGQGKGQGKGKKLAYGTYPLQEIVSTSSASPTILVGHFMNGNDAFLNSRAYLWNPSASAGAVTVRVFTLPHGGDSFLLGEVDLGMLAPSSARNFKLAEDILAPLGITLPYTDNGGNLTVEFTIDAANVRGAAQVFSSDMAYGTYPLQPVPNSSSVSPTVLVANLMNGNSEAFNSRAYLWNPSANAGAVTVRVFTLPLTGVSTLLGELDFGILGAESARNVKLAEDILFPLGISLPYTDDGGNLTVVFTIDAPNVQGAAQVFSSELAFGTYPLQEISSTTGPDASVLVAHFMNGNNAVFYSRVYLWNPSAVAGDITVRVFTLPIKGGTPQELTATPFNLGTLGAESGRNIRLAEDILAILGIPLPYTADGGNLMLEFTIGAPDVRGAGQVFSLDLAFGTYTLQ